MEKLPALYTLSAEFRDTLDLLADPDVDPLVVADTLAGIKGMLDKKAGNIAKLVENLQVKADARKAVALQKAEEAKMIENHIQRLKDYLLNSMLTAEVSKIEYNDDDCAFSISIRENAPHVVVDDINNLAPEYIKPPKPVEPEPDKKKIAKAFKEGIGVLGAHMERSTKLVIK